MLNLILAIIVFISSFFPRPKIEPAGQQKGGQNDGQDALIGESLIGVETQTQVDTVTDDSEIDESALKVSIEHAMVNKSTQTEDVAVSENHPPDASIPEMASPTIGAVVAHSNLSQSPAPERSIDETRTEETLQTREDTFTNSSSSSIIAAGATLVNTPTAAFSRSTGDQECGDEEIQSNEDPPKLASSTLETMAHINRALNQSRFQRADEEHAVSNRLEYGEQKESRSTDRLPEGHSPRQSVPIDESRNAYQDLSEVIAAVEANPMVQQESVRTEEVSHQQTREELAELDEWCNDLEDENARLHTQVIDTERENESLQRQLSDAERRIHKLTSSSIATIEILHRQVFALDTEISSYVRLGVSCYVRLQKIESLLNPFDRIYAEYQRLMIDAARQFTALVPHDIGTEPFGEGRVVEVDEDDHDVEEGGGDDEYDDSGMPVLGIHGFTCDFTEAGAGSAEDDFAALDDDDDDDCDDSPYPHRPMRPGAASRTPISAFAAMSGDMPQKASSSPFKSPAQPAQQAPSPAAPAFPIDFGFLKPSVKPEGKNETTAVQDSVQRSVQDSAYDAAASSTSRSRTYGKRGQGRPGCGTTRAKVSLHGGRGPSANAGFGSPPAATAFSVNYKFSEASSKVEDKNEDTAAPGFGSQASLSSDVFSSSVTADPESSGTAYEVEETQCPAQKAGNAPKFASDACVPLTTSAFNSNAAFEGFGFNTADVSHEPLIEFTPATEGANFSPSLSFNGEHPPKATPPPQQNKNIFSMPTGHLAKTKGKSVFQEPGGDDANALSTCAEVAPSLAAHYAKLIQSANTETGLREARTGKKKATGYQPDASKRSSWAPFPPKETQNVPPVWMPVSPTIRPFEFEHKKGDSSKSLILVGDGEEERIAKVKDWIYAFAPRDDVGSWLVSSLLRHVALRAT